MDSYPDSTLSQCVDLYLCSWGLGSEIWESLSVDKFGKVLSQDGYTFIFMYSLVVWRRDSLDKQTKNKHKFGITKRSITDNVMVSVGFVFIKL